MINTEVVKRSDVTTKVDFNSYGFQIDGQTGGEWCKFSLKYKRPESEVFDSVIECNLTTEQLEELKEAIKNFLEAK